MAKFSDIFTGGYSTPGVRADFIAGPTPVQTKSMDALTTGDLPTTIEIAGGSEKCMEDDCECDKSRKLKSIKQASKENLFRRAKSCGANADGGGGFQPGNTCAGGGDSESQEPHTTTDPKIKAWAEKQFNNEPEVKDFSRWFANSKVARKNGIPLEMFHGNRGKSDLESGWVSFTENEDHAGFFGDVQSAYLAIKNPIDISSIGSGGDPESKDAVSGKDLSDAFMEYGIEIDFGGENKKGFTTELMFKHKDEIKKKASLAGFDGILVTDYFEYDVPEYIAFDRSQIRINSESDGDEGEE